MNESPIENFHCSWDVLDDICEFFAYLGYNPTDPVVTVLDKNNWVLEVRDPKSGRRMECSPYGTPAKVVNIPLSEFLLRSTGDDLAI